MKRIVIFLLSALICTSMAAQGKGAKVVCGPYVQSVTETGFTVVWVTDMDAICWVETAPDDGTHFYNKDRQKFYDMRGYGQHPIGKIHKVRVDGLKPGETCRYRLMNKGVQSFKGSSSVKYAKITATDVYRGKPYEMKTFKEDYDTLRFDVYNDIHGKDSILQVLMSGGRKNIDFAALNGDMTSNIESPDMVQTMYLTTTAANLGGTTPLFASRGNHELRGKDAIRWFDYFETPTGYTYYTFRLGKFFFIVLDACEDKPDDAFEYSGTVISEGYLRQQETWLKSVIESDEFRTAEVKLAFCHIPPETKGWFGNVNVCRYFVPHLNKGGLDAMFCGHIHKWRYDEVGCGISDAEFPVVCLPNACRSEITATSENVMLEVYSPDGDRINSLEIKF